MATEALIREVWEETGLEVRDPVILTYVLQRDEPGGRQTVVYGFGVQEWRGEISCDDPDGLVLDARFFPLPQAIEAIRTIPRLDDPEPISAYLRGDAPPGTLRLYRTRPDGNDVLVKRVP